MNIRFIPLGGMAIGATLMYLLDPDQGRRRRALLRDQVISIATRVDDAVEAIARDLSNRAQGLAAEARSMFVEEDVPDEVLLNRVRSEMGRAVSHPSAIEVTAEQGRVTLSGLVLADEHIEPT